MTVVERGVSWASIGSDCMVLFFSFVLYVDTPPGALFLEVMS